MSKPAILKVASVLWVCAKGVPWAAVSKLLPLSLKARRGAVLTSRLDCRLLTKGTDRLTSRISCVRPTDWSLKSTLPLLSTML